MYHDPKEPDALVVHHLRASRFDIAFRLRREGFTAVECALLRDAEMKIDRGMKPRVIVIHKDMPPSNDLGRLITLECFLRTVRRHATHGPKVVLLVTERGPVDPDLADCILYINHTYHEPVVAAVRAYARP